MNHLLKAAAIILGMICMSNTSCNKEEIDGVKTSGFNTPIELGVNDKAILPKENKELLVTLISLSDSRCAKDVQCVWAGNAIAEVQLTCNDGSQSIIKLCIGECDKNMKLSDTLTVGLNNKIYTVVLNDVKGEGVNKAVLTITKK